MRVGISELQWERASHFVEKARRHGGLAPLDLDRFWSDHDQALKNPFGTDIAQVPLGALPTSECVFAELGIAEDYHRLLHDPGWTAKLAKAYNDKAEAMLGRRILSEAIPDPELVWPKAKALYDVFEARNQWHGESYWLQQAANSEEELEALLDRVEQRDLHNFLLPVGWEESAARLRGLGVPAPLYRSQRGPVTFATSIYGAENLIFLILDNPDLAARFRDAILRAMLQIADILDGEAGFTRANAPRGFRFFDDNCALLTPEMYEFFAVPILEAVFARHAPDSGDMRYQHSDSDMGHLLPILGRIGINRCNFGPNVSVAEIRKHLPKAVIFGQLAPFTLMRNEEIAIVAEFLRDFEMAREQRGLIFATAGSINNGSRLTSFRLLMSAMQELGCYQG